MPDGVGLVKPPKVKKDTPMSDAEVHKTVEVAEERIVVEMVNEQAKNYRILQYPLRIDNMPLAEQLIFICFSWTNLLPPLFTPAIDIKE